MRLLPPVTDTHTKSRLPWNLVVLGGVVVVIGAILAWREHNPDSMVSAGLLISVVGLVLLLVGVVEVVRRR